MILTRIAKNTSAAQAAFLGSFLLSLIALLNSPVINRDGILYIETARIFLTDGFVAANKSFNWPFLPILMALVSKLTGIGLEKTGHLLNALFMAGACALVVTSIKRKSPEAAWATGLVLLALPGLNQYRDELLREYGCWFFIMLAFWLAHVWSDTPRWGSALIVQICLGTAALFRPEALVFFPALIMWQVFAASKGEKWRRSLMIGGLPLLGLAATTALFLSGHLESGQRLAGEFGRINSARFDTKAKALADALIPYARDQAGTILFMGSLAIIPLKFLRQLGLFIIPLLMLFQSSTLRLSLSRAPLFAWALFAHFLVLSAFVVDMQFLAGRYIAVLSLLSAPFIGFGLLQLIQRFPHWKNATLLVALLIMLSNVVSLNPGQTHFIAAGEWLAENVSNTPRVYVNSSRVAYYAGWKTSSVGDSKDRQHLSNAIQQGKYDLVVLEVSRHETDIDSLLENNQLRVTKRFKSPRNDSVIIATHTPASTMESEER